MEVYIEVVILDNLFFNCCLISLVTTLWLPRPKKWRLFLSALFGTMYAVLAPMRSLIFLQHLIFKILVSGLMILIVYGWINIMDYIKRLVTFYAATAIMAGAIYAIGGMFFPIRASGGLLFISGPPLWLMLLCSTILVRGLKRAFFALKRLAGAQSSEARLSVRVGKRTISVKALIDTGSTLHDPLSGLPVVLLPGEKMKKLYPDGESIKDQTGDIYFHTVTGSGSVRAMKSDEIWLFQGSSAKRIEAMVAAAMDMAQPVAIVPADATLSF